MVKFYKLWFKIEYSVLLKKHDYRLESVYSTSKDSISLEKRFRFDTPHQPQSTSCFGRHLYRHASKRSVQTGFTLIELALVMAVIGILTAFAVLSFGSKQEYRDAATVQSAQGSLQSIVSQGSIRMDQRPSDLNANAVLTALQTVLNQNGTSSDNGITASVNGGTYTITIGKGANARSATFQIDSTSGDVQLTAINNFTMYVVDKSKTPWTIKKQ